MLVSEHADGNVSEFARLCELEESSVRQWLKGPSKPGLEKLTAIVRACSRSLDWLVLGDDASDSVKIPKLSFKASAGMGRLVLSDEPETASVPRELLQKLGLSAKNAALTESHGDSMYPTIASGEPLIVETGGEYIDGRIYVFTVGDEVFVKRLRRGTGHLIMVSDNPEWPTREEPIPPADNFRLIGRVRWVGRML